MRHTLSPFHVGGGMYVYVQYFQPVSNRARRDGALVCMWLPLPEERP